MAPPSAGPIDRQQSFLSFLSEEGAALDPEAIAELIWLAVHQPAMNWSRGRTSPTRRKQSNIKQSAAAGSGTNQRKEPKNLVTQPSSASTTTVSNFDESEPDPSRLEAQLLPQASIPGAERLPVWVNDPLDLLDPQELFEAVLPLMQPVAAYQSASLDEPATLDHYVQWRQLTPVWHPDQHYRFTLTLILDQGFSMTVWQPLLEHISDRLRGFHGFKHIQVVPWPHPTGRDRQESGDPGASEQVLDRVSAPHGDDSDGLTVVISDCAGVKWWGETGAGPGQAFVTLRRLGADQPLVIWQVLSSWMWSRTALGQGEAVPLRRSVDGAAWPFQLARPQARRLAAATDPQLPLPVFELTREGLRSWGVFMGGSPFVVSPGILLPVEPSETPCDLKADVTDVSNTDEEIEHEVRKGQSTEEDVLMPLRRFQHLASPDARRLMALFAASPVLTLPVMRLIQAALLEGTSTAALAEVVLSGLLYPVDGRKGSDPEALQLTLAASIRTALLKQQPPDITLRVIEQVTDFIAAHWSLKGWGSFRAFLTDPAFAAPIGQEQAQCFATLAADIIASLGGAYATFAERLRIAQRKDPWPRNLFRFEEVACEAAQLLKIPVPESFNFSMVVETELKPLNVSFEYATFGAGSGRSQTKGFPEHLSAENTHLTMLHIPSGHFLMGSPPNELDRFNDEGPQHEVHLREFFLAQTPITQAQWRAVAQWERQEHEEAELWPEQLDPDPVAKLSNPERFRGDERPVVNVNWGEAMAFCRRLRLRTGKNYTLPSEAQWEYACRAETTSPFHFGDTINTELANYDGRKTYGDGSEGVFRNQTTDVASFPANAWGLHDMHGNVREWCADHWHANYEGAPEDGRAWLDENANENQSRLLRGGAWGLNPQNWRSACRYFSLPDSRFDGWGFRVCCLPQDLILYP